MKEQRNENKMDKRAQIGNTILLNYTAKLRDGSIVGSTKNKEPMKLTLGKDQIHRSLEVVIVGMEEGESQIVTIPADKAYGPYRKNLVFTFNKTKFKNKEPKIGDYYKIRLLKGDFIQARVTKKNNSKVRLDANHILAGKDITYEIELIQIIN